MKEAGIARLLDFYLHSRQMKVLGQHKINESKHITQIRQEI